MPNQRATTHSQQRRSVPRRRLPTIANPQLLSYVADWAEFYVAYFKEILSRASLGGYLEETTGSERGFDIEAIWLELKRRVELYGSNPPYKIEETHLEPNLNWNTRPEYMACLLWALRGNPDQTTRAGKLFERISGEAARRYIGGELLLNGHPSSLLAQDIARELNEQFGEEPRPTYKDRGVDLVVWKKFDDSRRNQIILLMQCACGSNWKAKTTELVLQSWQRYIKWACPPTRGFTTPVVIADDEMLDISENAGLLLDRTRLYRNTKFRTLKDRGLREDLSAWCDRTIPLLIKGL